MILLVMVSLGNISLQVHAQDNGKKVYTSATIDDEFTDNRVIVVLNDEVSKINKDYTISDFEGIGCINVINLNENDEKQFDEFNKVLSLEFNFNSKLKVLETIDLLMGRNEILYAGPDFEIKINSISYNDTFNNLQWSTDDIELPTVCVHNLVYTNI